VAENLPVVKHLGKEAFTIGGSLRCTLGEMECGTSGPLILLDIPGDAIKAVEGMGDVHGRGHTPKEVRLDVYRQVNLHLARQQAAPATG
jgi:hypothetical protein